MELLPELEVILTGGERPSYLQGRLNNYEFETPAVSPAKPKNIWLNNTDLNAPYFGGNFNFLYNGGSPEATITFNTYVSYRKNFSGPEKTNFINNLKQAVAIWDNAAEIQVRDINGNYNQRIKLRFALNIVRDEKNSNKRTDVHENGTRSVWFLDKGRESVMRELNVFIGSARNALVHELGHVWGLLDEYKDRWVSMKFSPGHVGPDSPLLNDKISIMNEGYDMAGNSGEFRTRYFLHFGRAILNSFWNAPGYIIPVVYNGKTVSKTIRGRIALLKRNIDGVAPYPSDIMPFNPQFTYFQVAKR
jgi:hypothetical protein